MADNDTTADGADTLWMVTRPKQGDVIVRWRDLTDDEMARAIAHRNTLYGTTEEPT
ncbi:hypothetical protein ACVWZL_005839 [Bradyrhizobium sp. GM2.4]